MQLIILLDITDVETLDYTQKADQKMGDCVSKGQRASLGSIA